MFRFLHVLVCCALVVGSAFAADWSQNQWQILYTATTDSLLVVRGLNCSDGTVHLVVIVVPESGGYCQRYLQWSPTGVSGPLPWPDDLTIGYRDMNYDSVDQRQPAFLTHTTLWRRTPQGWDTLRLEETVEWTQFYPQCFTFDSTGSLHYVLYGGYSLYYVREGGNRPSRRDTISCTFELGCSSGNGTRVLAPRAESILIISGEDINVWPPYQPNMWFQHFFFADGDAPLASQSYGQGSTAVNPQLALNDRGDWMYSLYFVGTESVWTWKGGGNLPAGTDEALSSVTSNAQRVFWNAHESTFEVGAVMDESPSLFRCAIFDPTFEIWTEDTSFSMPTQKHTLHVMVDSLGRGHLFTVDSHHLWYFGPESQAVGDPFILPPSSFILSAYPNPFNPSTTISFSLPIAGGVTLKVFDLTGREVRVLANRQYAAGEHSIRFDGSALPSGLYFVHLETGPTQMTQKIALIK